MLLIHFRSSHWADSDAAVFCRRMEAWCVCVLIAGKWILLCEGVEETIPSYWEEERPVGNIQVGKLCVSASSKHTCGPSFFFQTLCRVWCLNGWSGHYHSLFVVLRSSPCLVNWLQQQNTASRALSINIPRAIPGTVLILMQNTNKLFFAWAIRAIKQSNNMFYLLPINERL